MNPIMLVVVAGIIPADAGSTGPVQVFDDGCRDHPRGCGEHQVIL